NEESTAITRMKCRKFGWVAAIAVIALSIVALVAALIFYNSIKYAIITIDISASQENAMFMSMAQSSGKVMNGRPVDFFTLRLNGLSVFGHPGNVTIDSYELSIYNDDGVLVGFDGGMSTTDMLLARSDIVTGQLNETTGECYTLLYISPVVTIQEGQKGYAECAASPHRAFGTNPTLSLRFEYT
ncbi:hypothetical protein PFISCL1PPCAC_25726, partial [Pristionchus fissidentatus]